MDGQEKLLDYETIKAAVAGEKWATEKVLAHYADYIDELPAGTRITIKRAAPSYAALRLSPAHPRNRYTRCASVPVSGANNDCNLRLSGLITASFKASPARFRGGRILYPIPVHTRHGCGDLAYRPASVCVVVHTDQIFFFHGKVHHSSYLQFIFLGSGRRLFRAGGLFAVGKLLADRWPGLANTHITALIFVNHGIYPVSVFYAGKAQGLIGQHGKEPVIVLGGSQCVKVR